MKRKNVIPPRSVVGKMGSSKILTILGSEWFAKFKAIRTPGRVVWCNMDLARTLGFAVPPSNRITPAFHKQLINALSYRAPAEDCAIDGRPTITLYADKYGGEGIGLGLGSGRAGFLPFGNLCLKGVGLTPLFLNDDPGDQAHSHGGVQLNHCLGEAVFGEVNQHLFSKGSTRILAIIDQDEFVVYRNKRRVAIALCVRSGTQLRPGHLLAKKVSRSSLLETFVKITKETKQLAMRNQATTGKTPDLQATMLRVIDDHARTTAEHFRWRMIHGAVTSSNMEMGGAPLDLTTRSTQPRTAPIYFREDYVSFFGHEHIDCATQLRFSYRALVKSIPQRQRGRLNAKSINFMAEMERAYAQHLQEQLLSATGLKTEVAKRIKKEHADLARRFTATLSSMCSLRNPGSVEMAKKLVSNVSVLDVFNLLREFPGEFFAAPNNKHTKFIRAALGPVFKGNRFHVHHKRLAVRKLIEQFDLVYRELMNTCKPYAKEYYGSSKNMRASITSRAAFENEPINLYRSQLYDDFEEAIGTYKSTGDADVLRAIVEAKLAASLRRVDALLAQGESRRLRDGGLEIEMRTINGVDYSIRVRNDLKQTRYLQVSIPVNRVPDSFETPLPGWPRITQRQVRLTRYRFTTDGWISSRVVGGRLEKDPNGRHLISFAVHSKLPRAGRLEGVFYLSKRADPYFGGRGATVNGYAFAIPDNQELANS